LGTAQSVISGDIKRAVRLGLLDKDEAKTIFREVRKANTAVSAEDAAATPVQPELDAETEEVGIEVEDELDY
jgi:hypothetical protein